MEYEGGSLAARADPRRSQPRSRRRLHVLGSHDGSRGSPGYEFEQVLADIQTLNFWALDARLECDGALAAYPFVQDDYALLPHGASIGSGYGPIVVAREPLTRAAARDRDRHPGKMTTAYLALRLVLGDAPTASCRSSRSRRRSPRAGPRPGSSSTRASSRSRIAGLRKVLDLGDWWLLETGLPLPLGVNTIRRDLGEEVIADVSQVLRESIQCGLDHRAEALEYAVQFGRGIDAEIADQFVSMYVNELTQDYGDEGRRAVAELLRRGEAIGAFPSPVRVDWVP